MHPADPLQFVHQATGWVIHNEELLLTDTLSHTHKYTDTHKHTHTSFNKHIQIHTRNKYTASMLNAFNNNANPSPPPCLIMFCGMCVCVCVCVSVQIFVLINISGWANAHIALQGTEPEENEGGHLLIS